MRLWHKSIIPVLPGKQLVSQWRECCCIAKNISQNGTPNHLLVNKILDYDLSHFTSYTALIIDEMKNRGYKVSKLALDNYNQNMDGAREKVNTNITADTNISVDTNIRVDTNVTVDTHKDYDTIPVDLIYNKWHTEMYLVQCYYNLEEKFQCGGIDQIEFGRILEFIKNINNL